MKSTTLACGLAILLVACASGMTHVVRGPATDAPPAFLMLDGATGQGRPVDPDPGCESPLADPRGGGTLMLVRSRDGLGDYEADGSGYGLSSSELLRIDCSNGAPVGRVAR